MYLIINKTKRSTSISKNGIEHLEPLLTAGHKIIVISFYSNTIKVPKPAEWDKNEWEWEDYHMPNYGMHIPEIGFTWPIELNKLP